MIYLATITLTFPSNLGLNNIIFETDSTIVTLPALPRPENNNNFLGWQLTQVTGNSLIEYSNQLLTKNNTLILASVADTILSLAPVEIPTIAFSISWGDFDDNTSNSDKQVERVIYNGQEVETVIYNNTIVDTIIVKE